MAELGPNTNKFDVGIAQDQLGDITLIIGRDAVNQHIGDVCETMAVSARGLIELTDGQRVTRTILESALPGGKNKQSSLEDITNPLALLEIVSDRTTGYIQTSPTIIKAGDKIAHDNIINAIRRSFEPNAVRSPYIGLNKAEDERYNWLTVLPGGRWTPAAPQKEPNSNNFRFNNIVYRDGVYFAGESPKTTTNKLALKKIIGSFFLS